MCWKDDTTLGDLARSAPAMAIEIERDGRTICTTPRELLNVARLPGFLSIAQVEFAFSSAPSHAQAHKEAIAL